VTTFFVPIEGLTLTEPWDLGPIRLHTAASLDAVLASGAKRLLDHEVIGQISREIAEEMRQGTAAQVDARDIDEALDLVTVATDILRVFQKTQYNMSKTTMFGLSGQIYRSRIRYIATGEVNGPGFRNRGEVLGFTLNHDAHNTWDDLSVFPRLAALVGENQTADGHRRALVGVQLLSQAILEHRPAFKVLNLIIGLESMLLDRRSESQGFRLARRASYFTCGRWNDSMCGRDRPSCQALSLDPGSNAKRQSLKRFRELAEMDSRWRCSEWLNYLRWYDSRSSVAHGDDSAVDQEDAGRAEYWVLSWTAEPVLRWLLDHPDNPLEALDDALASLRPVRPWQDPVPNLETYDPAEHDFSA
jgi:hypothetical protein